jgi:hypothetical protein
MPLFRSYIDLFRGKKSTIHRNQRPEKKDTEGMGRRIRKGTGTLCLWYGTKGQSKGSKGGD